MQNSTSIFLVIPAKRSRVAETSASSRILRSGRTRRGDFGFTQTNPSVTKSMTRGDLAPRTPRLITRDTARINTVSRQTAFGRGRLGIECNQTRTIADDHRPADRSAILKRTRAAQLSAIKIATTARPRLATRGLSRRRDQRRAKRSIVRGTRISISLRYYLRIVHRNQ